MCSTCVKIVLCAPDSKYDSNSNRTDIGYRSRDSDATKDISRKIQRMWYFELIGADISVQSHNQGCTDCSTWLQLMNSELSVYSSRNTMTRTRPVAPWHRGELKNDSCQNYESNWFGYNPAHNYSNSLSPTATFTAWIRHIKGSHISIHMNN